MNINPFLEIPAKMHLRLIFGEGLTVNTSNLSLIQRKTLNRLKKVYLDLFYYEPDSKLVVFFSSPTNLIQQIQILIGGSKNFIIKIGDADLIEVISGILRRSYNKINVSVRCTVESEEANELESIFLQETNIVGTLVMYLRE